MVATTIYHDCFPFRGGGERVALEFAQSFGADLVYAFRTEDSYPASAFPPNHRSLELGSLARRKSVALLGLALAFARERARAARYDVRIFSGITAPFAAPPRAAPGRNIFYCHSPPRILFDLKDRYLQRSGWLRRIGMRFAGPAFLHSYEHAVDRMHVVVANSKNVQSRLKTYLGRDSVVIYPPCRTDGFCWREPQGYYLSTGRLTPLKRVGAIIDAFLKMPGKRLVVASGGEEEAELRARAAASSNIIFTGWNDEEQLRSLMAGAIATIYVPVNEDFGMSPVESMAAGKPVIGVAEGGLLETVVHEQTGFLVRSGFCADDLAEAVEWMGQARARDMRAACEARAQLFSRENSLRAMRAIVEDA